MKTISLTVKDTKQAKLTIKPGDIAIIKVPEWLSKDEREILTKKLMKIADNNAGTQEHLKLYFKIGTPYFFLNRSIGNNKKETVKIYEYDKL